MRKAIIPAILLVLALFFTAKSSCSNKEIIPFLGKWSGSFVVEQITKGPDTEQDRKRSSLNGYLQLLANRRSFNLHLEGEQETLDLKGSWTIKGNRVTLQVKDFAIDDQGGENVRDPNRKFIPAEEIRKAYARPLVLDLSADKKRYTGLPMTLGDQIGRHRFEKDSY